jgi:hypothetical protein
MAGAFAMANPFANSDYFRHRLHLAFNVYHLPQGMHYFNQVVL